VEKQPGGGILARTEHRSLQDGHQRRDRIRGAAYASDAEASNRSPRSKTPRVEIQEASGHLVEALDLDEGAEVVTRHQERFIDDEPWSMQTSYYRMAFVDFVGLAIPP
jgi:DNA-binding GntR family transcriptional regulator